MEALPPSWRSAIINITAVDIRPFCNLTTHLGRIKSITHPAVGNHEYLHREGPAVTQPMQLRPVTSNILDRLPDSKGAGYYSYDIGTWHLIALNPNCGDAGGCNLNSAQGKWLEADLTAHTNFCTLGLLAYSAL